jgi:hypothetical protein
MDKWKLRVDRKREAFHLAGLALLLAPFHIMVNGRMSLPLVAFDEYYEFVKFLIEAWE